jgi:regulator of protease activity HflC (stomatin/prohibitin superfamily)
MWSFRKVNKEPLVHNPRRRERRADFALKTIGIALLVNVVAFALAIRFAAGGRPSALDFGALVAAPFVTAAAMTLFPRWSAALKLLIILTCAIAAWRMAESGLFLAFAATGALAAPAVQKLEEWERAIILRFGRFHRVRGPGLYFLLPVADRIAKTVDLRIRVTDFSAETTLSRDSVTVTVDALCFWLVWDAEKAILEVQDYEEAVVLSAKTALRAAISRNDLTTFLEKGNEIENQIRAEVDKKTTEWGITIQHIEITDIQIPEGLQDSLSRLAQAEREKMGRVLLAEAEIEIAHRLEDAAKIYGANELAMKLKTLSILNEGLKAGNSMMLVPNSITEELKSKDLFGLQALTETKLHVEGKDKTRRGVKPSTNTQPDKRDVSSETKEDGHARR